jgi:2-methylcitrate dehydratase
MHDTPSSQRPDPDPLLVEIADYVLARGIESKEAYDTARLCLMDSIGCMMLALNFPACTKLLGPVVPGAEMKGGVRGRVQHRRARPLAGLQRHVARGRVGAPLG